MYTEGEEDKVIVFTKPCGCYIRAFDDTCALLELNYCPKHSACDDMYEAIRWVLEDYRDNRATTSLAVSTHTRLLNALSKAEVK